MPVPRLNLYYPTEGQMNRAQRVFYKEVERSLRKTEYINVEGNIGYVFTFLYNALSNYNKYGYENLNEFLTYLSELYINEEKLSHYCLFWAYDCLLTLERFEEFLDRTEPKYAFGTSTRESNLRLNIQKHTGLDANPLDILRMSGGRKTKFITENQPIYKDKIMEVFVRFSKGQGGWFNIFDKWSYSREPSPYLLFSGAVIPRNPELSIPVDAYY